MGRVFIGIAVVFTASALLVFACGGGHVYSRHVAVALLILSVISAIIGGIVFAINNANRRKKKLKNTGRPISMD